MHVAGRVAEVVAGVPYTQLLDQRVTGPLGMSSTSFVLGTPANPRVAGGLGSSLPDYEQLLDMLITRGFHAGQSFLSAATVATIVNDRVNGLPGTCVPPAVDRVAYGTGCWIDTVGPGGFTNEASSPGAFGFNPWIDLRRGYYGIVMQQGQNLDVDPLVEQIQAGIRQRVDALRRSVGDANSDGAVSGADLSIVLAQFGQSVAAGTGSDFNFDGVVNGADLSILLANFGSAC
jgi:CubicO group peptidase (beta-lactamase class C family)